MLIKIKCLLKILKIALYCKRSKIWIVLFIYFVPSGIPNQWNPLTGDTGTNSTYTHYILLNMLQAFS